MKLQTQLVQWLFSDSVYQEAQPSNLSPCGVCHKHCDILPVDGHKLQLKFLLLCFHEPDFLFVFAVQNAKQQISDIMSLLKKKKRLAYLKYSVSPCSAMVYTMKQDVQREQKQHL